MTDIERIVAAIAGYLDGLESVGFVAATDVSDGPNRRYLVDGVIDLADMAKAIAEVRSAAAGGGAMSAGDARAYYLQRKLITLTHFAGPKIKVAAGFVAAIVPPEVVRAVGQPVDSQTKAVVVLSNGIAYHVRETPAQVEKAVSGPGK